MESFLKRYNVSIISFLLILLSFHLMSKSVSDKNFAKYGSRFISSVLSPIQILHHNTFKTVNNYWKHYLWLLEVESEREELIERVKALEANNSKLIEYKNENERLRRLLNFSKREEFNKVASTVIGRDPSNWVKSIVIDSGSSDGIKEGSSVVDGNAIVGQVISVSSRTSRVLLLTDRSSSIACIDQNTRAPGFVEGNSEGGLNFNYVERDYKVKPGERVIASGVDRVFPKGVLVGIITKVTKNEGDLFQTVELIPSVDLERLENVLVLVPKEKSQVKNLLEK